jgi:vacuolar-type H+-ATPase subunit B/Vma2
MEVGWRLLATLPRSELARLSDGQIERYLSGHAVAAVPAP